MAPYQCTCSKPAAAIMVPWALIGKGAALPTCSVDVMLQIVFFLMGCCYGASTFITAATVYISAYKEVPQGQCKTLVKACAWVSQHQPAAWRFSFVLLEEWSTTGWQRLVQSTLTTQSNLHTLCMSDWRCRLSGSTAAVEPSR